MNQLHRVVSQNWSTSIPEGPRWPLPHRSEHSLYEAIFHNSLQYITLLTPEGTVLEVNQTTLRLAGGTAGSVIQRPIWDAPWWSVSPGTRSALQQAVAEAAQGKTVSYETELVGQGDRLITVDACLQPIYNEHHQLVCLLLECRDVSRRKQAQAEIYRLNAELEERVAQRTTQLEDLNHQKEQALQRERHARQQAELMQTELQRYVDIVQNMQIGFVVWRLTNPDDVTSLELVLFNPAAEELMQQSLKGCVGQRILDCFPYLAPADVQTLARVALDGVTEARHDTRYDSPATTKRYFSYKGFPLPDRCVGVAFEDITHRRRAEIALRESESRYATLAGISPVGIFRTNQAGNYLYVNRRWCEIAGIAPNQAMGEGWGQTLHPDDRARVLQNWHHARQANLPFEAEYRFQRPDQTITWVFGQAAAETNEIGEVVGYVGTITDITALKQTESALQASERRYSALANTSPVGIFRCSAAGHCLYVNERWTEITGLTLEEAKNFGWYHAVHPDDYERVVAESDRCARDNQLFRAEFRFLRADGQVTWVVGQTSPELSDQGNLLSFVGTITDITDLKDVELALYEHAAELAYLNRKLKDTAAKLEERNRELNQFAYVASHDLKAPLRAIANLSEWIEEDLADKLPAENQHQMQLLRGRVYRMEALINGLLEYSRVGRTHAPTEAVNLATLLDEVIDSLGPPPEFHITIQPNMPTLTTKRLLLRQVFANLIGNAIKHHPRLDGHLAIAAHDLGSHYEFVITDDGEGIAPEHHERVFAIFQTLQARDQRESTGIGLAIVKKIVETEGGTISLDSQVGSGTTFRVTWPKQPSFTEH